MIIRINLTVIIVLLINCFVQGQNDTKANRYLSIGTKTAGICFGNSNIYNGIRFNLWDKGLGIKENEAKLINGINVSFSVNSKVSNGIQLCGLVSNSETINGISIAPTSHNARKINGFASSFWINSDTLNGLFIGFGVAASEPIISNKVIDGVAVGIMTVGAEKVKGATICMFWCYSKEQCGLSIAGYNRTEYLHGLQIGLLNYAGNNPKLLRRLPLLNFHL
jgi:hypothetical protein